MWVVQLCVWLFLVLSCKPIARQEPASEAQIALGVRTFKQMMDGNKLKPARRFLTTNLDKKEIFLVRESVDAYLADGNNYARFGDLLRSYTHSAPAVALNNKLDNLIASIAVSKNDREVAGLLTQVERYIERVESLYLQRNRVFLTTRQHGDDNYQLLLDMRNDFGSWRRSLQQDLDKSMRKYTSQTGAFWPENFRARIIDLRQQLESFNNQLGIRSDRVE